MTKYAQWALRPQREAIGGVGALSRSVGRQKVKLTGSISCGQRVKGLKLSGMGGVPVVFSRESPFVMDA